MNRNAQEDRLRISRLHRLLRHNPANPLPLRLAVKQTADGRAAVTAGGIETTMPLSGHRKPEDILRFMLKHYPEPVFINGEEVERAAFEETPTIIRIAETGAFNSRMTRSDISGPAGKPAGLTLSEGLTYLNDADEGGRARRAVLPGEPPPGAEPQFGKAEFWEVWFNLELSREEAEEALYHLNRAGYPCCSGSDATAKTIGQLNHAARLIRETLPSAPAPRWENIEQVKETAGHGVRRIWTPEGNGALAFPLTGQTPATPDARSGSQAAIYSMVRALLQNPETGILPVQPDNETAATITCEKAEVRWSDGRSAIFGKDELDGPEEMAGHPEEIFMPRRACAESIVITAVLKQQDGAARTVAIPAGILALGQVSEHSTWIAKDQWTGKSAQDIAEAELQALWGDEAEERNWDPHELYQGLATWWIRALEGEEAAFDHELRRLAQEFHTQSAKPQESRTTLDGAGGASLTWRPAGTWDWLDEAVRDVTGANPNPAAMKRITEAAQERLLKDNENAVRRAIAQAAADAGII